jgi:3-hydroxyacyl-[acyl-carrier-protein] dehydratase
VRADPIAALPWDHPFRMLDRLVECEPHRRIVTEKRISLGDPLCAGRGEAEPWFPSLLLLEGLGQSAALLYRLSYGDAPMGGLPLLGWLRATLEGSARAGDLVTFEVRSTKMTRQGGVFAGTASCGGASLAGAELALSAAAPVDVASEGSDR